MNKTSDLSRLTAVFLQAFERLDVSVPLQDVEQLAQVVYDAMTGHRRSYHNLEHIFTFVDPDNPVLNLAALYHDIVYYQVDRGITPAIEALLSPGVIRDGDTFSIAPNIDPSDVLFCLTLMIFDIQPGDVLSPQALNEFLSAIVMVRTLGRFIPKNILVQILVFIEATIPFRPPNARGQTPFEAMEERLANLPSQHCELYLSKDEIESIIKNAVIFANKDIANFAEEAPAAFLANTWKLLPETNLELNERRAYTVGNYRRALEKTEKFLRSLDPELIFSRYLDVPSADEFAQLTERARFNIKIAVQYLRIRLVTISLVDALAQATGGDVPLVKFMGGYPGSSAASHRIENYLPAISVPPWANYNKILFGLLGNGRNSRDRFDVQNSPISFYVYSVLSPESQLQAYAMTQAYGAGTLTPEDFLAKMDRDLVSNIARAASKMLPERWEAFSRWIV